MPPKKKPKPEPKQQPGGGGGSDEPVDKPDEDEEGDGIEFNPPAGDTEEEPEEDEEEGGGTEDEGGGGGEPEGGGGGEEGPEDTGGISGYLEIARGRGVRITPEVRALAEKAKAEGWASSEFLFKLRSTKAWKDEIREESMSYLEAARGRGVSITPEVLQLARKAAREGWNVSQFLFDLRSTDAWKENIREEAGAFLETARSRGLAITDEVRQLARKATREGWSAGTFLFKLRGTDAWKQNIREESSSYLEAARSRGVGITDEVRDLARKAAREGWDASQFLNRLRGTTAWRQEIRQRSLRYTEMATRLGLGTSDNLAKLALKAAREGWDSSQFMQMLRRTEDYQERFKGIKPGMTEAEYTGRLESMKEIAAGFGFRYERDMYQSLIRKGMTPTLFRTRMQALSYVTENRAQFKALENTLKARGAMRPNDTLTLKQAAQIVLGKAPGAWQEVWAEARLRAVAAQAGMGVGAGISRQRLLHLQERIEGGFLTEGDVGKGLTSVARQLRQLIPLERLTKFGITKGELFELEFGTNQRRKLELEAKVGRIINTYQAALTGASAKPQFVPTQQGGQFVGFETDTGEFQTQ